MSAPSGAPGDHVRWFASKVGWAIQPGVNVVVEGDHDVRYCRLADIMHQRMTGRRLLGDGFHVLAAGVGNAGGTDGIMRHFVSIHKAARLDLRPDDLLPVFRLAALLDDDMRGREAFHYLTANHTDCLRWRDVFLLQRQYPNTRDLKQIELRIKALNLPWKAHNCEIEDLLPKPMIDLFHEEHTNCFSREPEEVAGRWHFEFAIATKGLLCTYVEHLASPEDLNEIINALKALRFFLAVNPIDGSPPPAH
jgi:hypothetical protein